VPFDEHDKEVFMRFFPATLHAPLARALLLLTGSLAATAHAAPLQVEESAVFAAPPARVWKIVGDYRGIADWHPAVARTEIVKGRNNARGAVRSIVTRDGATIVEELLAYEGGRRTLRYRIVESPLPVRDYVSTLSVQPEGKGARVVWKSEFNRSADVDDARAREIIAGIYQAGFGGVRARLGEGAAK
jgi:mxaD protein